MKPENCSMWILIHNNYNDEIETWWRQYKVAIFTSMEVVSKRGGTKSAQHASVRTEGWCLVNNRYKYLNTWRRFHDVITLLYVIHILVHQSYNICAYDAFFVVTCSSREGYVKRRSWYGPWVLKRGPSWKKVPLLVWNLFPTLLTVEW